MSHFKNFMLQVLLAVFVGCMTNLGIVAYAEVESCPIIGTDYKLSYDDNLYTFTFKLDKSSQQLTARDDPVAFEVTVAQAQDSETTAQAQDSETIFGGYRLKLEKEGGEVSWFPSEENQFLFPSISQEIEIGATKEDTEKEDTESGVAGRYVLSVHVIPAGASDELILPDSQCFLEVLDDCLPTAKFQYEFKDRDTPEGGAYGSYVVESYKLDANLSEPPSPTDCDGGGDLKYGWDDFYTYVPTDPPQDETTLIKELRAGVHDISLTVIYEKDGVGYRDETTESIDVKGIHKPVAIITPEKIQVKEGQEFEFSGEASFDPDYDYDLDKINNIKSYTWSVYDDDFVLVTKTGLGKEDSFSHTLYETGTFRIELEVKDKDGMQSTIATALLEVEPNNDKPEINLEQVEPIPPAPLTVRKGQEVKLTAHVVNEQEGSLTYEWLTNNEPCGDFFQEIGIGKKCTENKTPETFSTDMLPIGEYTVTVNVTNNSGKSSAVSEHVTVLLSWEEVKQQIQKEFTVTQPLGVASDDIIVGEGSLFVSLSTKSFEDVEYEWTTEFCALDSCGSECLEGDWSPYYMEQQESSDYNWTFDEPNKYRITLKISDDHSTHSHEVTQCIIVKRPPLPHPPVAIPKVQIEGETDVSEGDTYNAPLKITLNGQESTGGSSSNTYEWQITGYPDDLERPFQGIVQDVTLYAYGKKTEYTITLTVTDPNNSSSVSNTDTSEITVTVDRVLPIADLKATSPTTIKVGDTISFEATGSHDPDRNPNNIDPEIKSYKWIIKKNGEDYRTDVSSLPVFSFSFNEVSDYYKVTLVVVDAEDNESVESEPITVQVKDKFPPKAVIKTLPGLDDGEEIIAPLVITKLDASHSDPAQGSEIVAYHWEVFSTTGDFARTSDKEVFEEQLTLSPGIYHINLTVKNVDGIENDVTKTITVLDPVNQEPIAIIDTSIEMVGSTITIKEGSQIYLKSKSTDVDGYIVTTKWTAHHAETGEVYISEREGDAVSMLFEDEGIYSVQLVIIDNVGATSETTNESKLTINVKKGEPPTISKATVTPQGGSAPLTVTLIASADDSDGTIESIRWSFIKSDGTEISPQEDDRQLVLENEGVFEAKVVATDNDGLTTTINVGDITVETVPNRNPVAKFTRPPTLEEGLITLDASSSEDVDGYIIEYVWKITNDDDGRTIFELFGKIASCKLKKGNYSIILTVMDDDKAFSTSAPETVVVPGQLPVAKAVVSPSEGKTPLTVSLNGEFSYDPDDGTISDWKWYKDGKEHELSGPKVIMTFTEPGAHVIKLVVTDNDDLESEPIEKTVVVHEGENPIARIAEVSPSEGYAPLTVTFNGKDSYDPNGGNIKLFEWYKDGGEEPEEEGQLEKVTFTFTEPGSHTVKLVVTNDKDLKSEATEKTVTVNVNPVPVAKAVVSPTEGEAPLTVTLNGEASHDPDGGTIVEFKWYKDDGEEPEKYRPEAEMIFTESGTVKLVVVDDEGLESEEVIETITVTQPACIAAITNPVSSIEGNAPLTVTFEGESPNCDSGRIVKYLWYKDGAKETETDGSQVEITFTELGSHFVQLVVIYDDTLESELSEQVIIHIDCKEGECGGWPSAQLAAYLPPEFSHFTFPEGVEPPPAGWVPYPGWEPPDSWPADLRNAFSAQYPNSGFQVPSELEPFVQTPPVYFPPNWTQGASTPLGPFPSIVDVQKDPSILTGIGFNDREIASIIEGIDDFPSQAIATVTPKKGFEGFTATFNGEGSRPGSGASGINKYQWLICGRKPCSDNGDERISETGKTVDFGFKSSGQNYVELIVTDDKGSTSEPSHYIEVTVLPKPPIKVEPEECLVDDVSSSAKLEKCVEPVSIGLFVSGISEELSYEWTIDKDGQKIIRYGPNGELNESGEEKALEPLSAGEYTIKVVITLGEESSSATTVGPLTFIVEARLPIAVITQVKVDANKQVVRLDGSGSNAYENEIVNYEWTFKNGDEVIQHSSEFATIDPTFTKLIELGLSVNTTYTVTLVITDEQGRTSAPSSAPSEEPKTIKIPTIGHGISPVADAEVTMSADGKQICLNGSNSSDEDGEVTNFEWEVLMWSVSYYRYGEKAETGDEGILGNHKDEDVSINYNSEGCLTLSPGVHFITLAVEDNDNLWSNPTPSSVIVVDEEGNVELKGEIKLAFSFPNAENYRYGKTVKFRPGDDFTLDLDILLDLEADEGCNISADLWIAFGIPLTLKLVVMEKPLVDVITDSYPNWLAPFMFINKRPKEPIWFWDGTLVFPSEEDVTQEVISLVELVHPESPRPNKESRDIPLFDVTIPDNGIFAGGAENYEGEYPFAAFLMVQSTCADSPMNYLIFFRLEDIAHIYLCEQKDGPCGE